MRIVGFAPTGIPENKNGVRKFGGTMKLKRKGKSTMNTFPNTELKNINRSHQPFADTIIIPFN